MNRRGFLRSMAMGVVASAALRWTGASLLEMPVPGVPASSFLKSGYVYVPYVPLQILELPFPSIRRVISKEVLSDIVSETGD